jgi:hypothetical protein
MLLTPVGTVNSCSPAVAKLTVSALARGTAVESRTKLTAITPTTRGLDPPVID